MYDDINSVSLSRKFCNSTSQQRSDVDIFSGDLIVVVLSISSRLEILRRNGRLLPVLLKVEKLVIFKRSINPYPTKRSKKYTLTSSRLSMLEMIKTCPFFFSFQWILRMNPTGRKVKWAVDRRVEEIDCISMTQILFHHFIRASDGVQISSVQNTLSYPRVQGKSTNRFSWKALYFEGIKLNFNFG